MCHGGEILSCVVWPPAPLSSCQPLSRHTSCAGLLQKKIKSYFRERVLSSTSGNYCQSPVTLCWSVTSRVWGLCCGFLIPVPPQPPQVATSLQSASRMTVASVGAQEEETILIPPGPTWPSVGNKTSIPSTLFRYDLAWRGGLAHKKCHPLFYNPRNRQFGEQSVIPVDQDGTTEGQSW